MWFTFFHVLFINFPIIYCQLYKTISFLLLVFTVMTRGICRDILFYLHVQIVRKTINIYPGLRLWSSLSPDIQSCCSICWFKRSLKWHYLENNWLLPHFCHYLLFVFPFSNLIAFGFNCLCNYLQIWQLKLSDLTCLYQLPLYIMLCCFVLLALLCWRC